MNGMKKVFSFVASEVMGNKVGEDGGLGQVYRFSSMKAAKDLAAVSLMYGRPVQIKSELVPKRLCDRWGIV
jgi:hypothetical protein